MPLIELTVQGKKSFHNLDPSRIFSISRHGDQTHIEYVDFRNRRTELVVSEEPEVVHEKLTPAAF